MSDSTSKNKWLRWLAIAAVVVVILGIFVWCAFFREVPQHFSDIAEAYKYGSIGGENAQGIPYWIWFILPKMFPEYLPSPGGYASVGLPWERAREAPVGISIKTIGFKRVAFNCAFCHTATVRLSENAMPIIIPGGPGHQFDPLTYQDFLFKCANDPRFTTTNVLNAIAGVYKMPWYERMLYRVLIPATRRALNKEARTFAWTYQLQRRPWGHGRVDPFNPAKIALLDLGPGDTIGNSDMPPIYNLQGKPSEIYHWDGLNSDLDEVFRSSALGDGATPNSIQLQYLTDIRNYLASIKPPKFPFPVNEALAAQGKPVYDQNCASCHGPNGDGAGVITPAEEVGTDTHRLGMWSQEAADRYNAYVKKPWKFTHFRKINGYAADDLHALWIRGPFLHNGSVPTLRDLLNPPDERPESFWRGNDVVDPVNVGFVSNLPAAHHLKFTFYDTNRPGNSNMGHEYGTTLDDASKAALLEYLKTL